MPKINTYQQQTNVSGAGTGIARPRRGGGIAGLAAAAADSFERVRRRDEATEVSKALADLRLKSTQRYIDAQNSAADDAKDFTPGILKQFDEDLEEIKTATSSNRARRALADASIEMRENVGQRALVFEANRRAGARVATTRKAIDDTRAALELDPDQFESAIVEQSAAIDEAAVDPAHRQELREYLAAQLFEGAAIGVAKQNPKDALAKLARTDSGDKRFDALNADQRRKLEVYAKNRLADVTSNEIVERFRVDARAGTKALAELEKADMDPEVKNAVRSQVRAGVGLLHSERRAEHAEEVNTFERAIASDTPGANAEAQASSLYRRGVYSPEQYTAVLEAIDGARQKGAKKAAELAAIQEALSSGQRLDPRDKDVVKAVDTWFTESAKINQVQPGSDEWVNNAAAIANRTNILPPEAMSWARKTILSGQPQLAIPAANAMARWADAAPAAYAFFDDPLLKANAEAIDGMVRAGTAPAKAVEIARATTFDIPKPRQDELRASYVKGKYAADNADELQGFMNGDDAFDRQIIGGAPEPSLGMRDEFNGLVRTYYDYTNGDIDRARELAWKDIRGTYGISTVNGEPEVLKYAPELVYPGMDPKVIQVDIAESAKAAGVTTPVRMTPARVTGDTHGLLWNLSTVDEDGNTEIVLDEKNRPLIYAIPTDTQKYVDAQNNAKREAIEKARAESKARREALEMIEAGQAFGGVQ